MHSPFAFRYVREVLTQRYAYYCYPRLERAARADGTSVRAVRALFRVALWARQCGLEVIGNPSQSMQLALDEGFPSHSDEPGDKACAVGVGHGRESVVNQWATSASGMLFSSPEMEVFVKFDHLPHQRFRIVLP